MVTRQECSWGESNPLVGAHSWQRDGTRGRERTKDKVKLIDSGARVFFGSSFCRVPSDLRICFKLAKERRKGERKGERKRMASLNRNGSTPNKNQKTSMMVIFGDIMTEDD